jgi:hypothetical protein
MSNEELPDGNSVVFTVINSTVEATDIPMAVLAGGTTSMYIVSVVNVSTNSFDIMVKNESGGSLSEELVLNFAIIKGVTN